MPIFRLTAYRETRAGPRSYTPLPLQIAHNLLPAAKCQNPNPKTKSSLQIPHLKPAHSLFTIPIYSHIPPRALVHRRALMAPNHPIRYILPRIPHPHKVHRHRAALPARISHLRVGISQAHTLLTPSMSSSPFSPSTPANHPSRTRSLDATPPSLHRPRQRTYAGKHGTGELPPSPYVTQDALSPGPFPTHPSTCAINAPRARSVPPVRQSETWPPCRRSTRRYLKRRWSGCFGSWGIRGCRLVLWCQMRRTSMVGCEGNRGVVEAMDM